MRASSLQFAELELPLAVLDDRHLRRGAVERRREIFERHALVGAERADATADREGVEHTLILASGERELYPCHQPDTALILAANRNSAVFSWSNLVPTREIRHMLEETARIDAASRGATHGHPSRRPDPDRGRTRDRVEDRSPAGAASIATTRAEDVIALRGSVREEHTLARRGAENLWNLHPLGATTSGSPRSARSPATRPCSRCAPG